MHLCGCAARARAIGKKIHIDTSRTNAYALCNVIDVPPRAQTRGRLFVEKITRVDDNVTVGVSRWKKINKRATISTNYVVW